jgi:hypothetical protein
MDELIANPPSLTSTSSLLDSDDDCRHPGIKRLVAAIIEQAVNDYRNLEKQGVIDGGKITRESLNHRRACEKKKVSVTDAESAMRFFHLDSFDSMCRFLHLKPEAIRYKLGIGEV